MRLLRLVSLFVCLRAAVSKHDGGFSKNDPRQLQRGHPAALVAAVQPCLGGHRAETCAFSNNMCKAGPFKPSKLTLASCIMMRIFVFCHAVRLRFPRALCFGSWSRALNAPAALASTRPAASAPPQAPPLRTTPVEALASATRMRRKSPESRLSQPPGAASSAKTCACSPRQHHYAITDASWSQRQTVSIVCNARPRKAVARLHELHKDPNALRHWTVCGGH